MTSAEYRRHLPLVELVARRIRAKHGHVRPGPDFDDLVAFGSKGLLEAALRFDQTREVSFRTYAYHRIHGAMMDGVRQMGAYSRADIERHRNDPEAAFTFVAFDESVAEDGTGTDPEDRVDRHLAIKAALRLLDRMPESKRTLVRSYFFEGLKLDEIGARRGQSKSWMCRLLAQALVDLRGELSRAYPELAGPERRVA